jgi:hypothetical protein
MIALFQNLSNSLIIINTINTLATVSFFETCQLPTEDKSQVFYIVYRGMVFYFQLVEVLSQVPFLMWLCSLISLDFSACNILPLSLRPTNKSSDMDKEGEFQAHRQSHRV